MLINYVGEIVRVEKGENTVLLVSVHDEKPKNGKRNGGNSACGRKVDCPNTRRKKHSEEYKKEHHSAAVVALKMYEPDGEKTVDAQQRNVFKIAYTLGSYGRNVFCEGNDEGDFKKLGGLNGLSEGELKPRLVVGALGGKSELKGQQHKSHGECGEKIPSL